MSVPHTASAPYDVRGMLVTDHRFTVPLDHAVPDGGSITVFAREYSDAELPAGEVEDLPWLLYLQGGPGGKGNRLLQFGGWTKAAAKHFRVLMLDQRGTGLSTPADRQTLPLRGDAAAQAAYLAHFRADSIVADAELIREALGSGPWSTYGQSYGGFCTLTYLSFAPEGLRECLVTGGLAPLAGPADRVYEATFRRVAARNAEYFSRYPEDRELTTRIARHLESVPEYLPSGERLSVRRFQMAGSYLGGNTRVDGLHYLLQEAFVPTPDGERLSDTFLESVHGLVSRAANPLYAVLHESIYAQGQATNWAAERVLQSFPAFEPTAPEPLYTGEMVYPWYFDEDPALVPLRDTAELLARKADWGPLYDAGQLARNTVPVAAAVYTDDIYVDRDLSLETAEAVRGLQVWESADFHHDGIADDGEAIFGRLLDMVRGQDTQQ
ncbi:MULTISPECIES: alpha/beta fold hydrolase [unclassified Arthrobacter]|uniref:alpha/beta fold hydrolase n=1 Tax=unclassified Arthrobacter TaxID=235627 RepID=UPI001E50B50D|nr:MULTISPECIES: alpha/beta fold hydrolase [unclassified Arthrobacter]MCC9145347.1 alpha/beta hydrolase [Arthrobacter sp. zg-Y919]MDK1276575.1 alpha/beta fold hydrolase [Arthrobacter sp. zg.Y919]WIB01836.1 alpha/beta fold hydrolase [Arthrobacter sp. zg-Y919]